MEKVMPIASVGLSVVHKAGGKAAMLGELVQAGMPVPSGCVILSTVFDEVLAENGVLELVRQRMGSGSDAGSLQSISREIMAAVERCSFPGVLEQEILSAFDKLGCPVVAVRSSATVEDNKQDSWAGRLDTFLNTTRESLLLNVRKCWASLFSVRALTYWRNRLAADSHASVAVVIQEMVPADVAGVAFSVNPVTEDRNELIIEAAFGLGEAVVQGSLTPDHYQVGKADMAVSAVFPSPQERGLYRLLDGSTGWKNLAPADVERQKLDSEAIVELARMVCQLENHFQFPCDVEWARRADRFYILQCRPITTL